MQSTRGPRVVVPRRDMAREKAVYSEVFVRPMTPEERAWIESLKPPVKPKKGEWRR